MAGKLQKREDKNWQKKNVTSRTIMAFVPVDRCNL